MKRIIIISATAVMIFGMIIYLSAQNYHKDYSYIYVVRIHEDNYLYINVIDKEKGLNFAPEHGCDIQTWA